MGDGRALARALAKIDAGVRRVPVQVRPTRASTYLVNPLTGRTAWLSSLFSTHPPAPATSGERPDLAHSAP